MVSGVVKDSVGTALAEVTVSERGTQNAVRTGADGAFTISVAGTSSVLVFSSVGYSSQELRVGNQKSITVSLLQATTGLQEVVVVGYGSQKMG